MRVLLSCLVFATIAAASPTSPAPPPAPPAVAPSGTPTPAAPTPSPDGPGPTITLLATGDLTLGQHYETWLDERVAKDGWTREQWVRYGFDAIRAETAGADLFVTNLECPFTFRGEKVAKNFTFRARPELAQVLADGGVDAVSLANNHLYDYGPDPVFDTVTAARAHGIATFGAGGDLAAARAPAIVERGGLKVAFLGYFFLGDRNIEPPEVYAGEGKPGVAGCFAGDECIGAMVEQDVRAALAKADLVVPFFHWGREAQDEVMPYQRTLARRAVDAGAKLVLGAHPHVVHGVEVYRGVPIVYSLGNFIFGGNWNPRTVTAMAVRARVNRTGVLSMELLPMQYTNPPDRRFQPRWLQGAEREAVVEKVAKLSAVFEETLPALVRTAPAVEAAPPK